MAARTGATTKTKHPAKRATAKPPAKAKKTPVKKSQKITEKPVSTAIDFCDVKLTALKRGFIINYCTPGQPYFHNALQAALAAGYKKNTANSEIYRTLQDPNIQKIIQKNERMFHMALRDSAMRAIELKQRRAFYDPVDYFEKKQQTRTTKDGSEYQVEVVSLKDLETMTPEQRMCIDGLDVKGQASIPVYLMPDRGKEINEIIKLESELSKSLADTSEEETREIIMERITIRETKRARRPVDIEYEIVERPTETDEDGEEVED
jgi:hypothetical protein